MDRSVEVTSATAPCLLVEADGLPAAEALLRAAGWGLLADQPLLVDHPTQRREPREVVLAALREGAATVVIAAPDRWTDAALDDLRPCARWTTGAVADRSTRSTA